MELIQIENKSAKLKLNEVVHQPSVEKLVEEIGKVFGAQAFSEGADFGMISNCIENAADTLEIDIHSPGGSVLDGYVLYNELNALRERGVYVTANITLAASMASVIAMAADKIVMKKGARMMIHEASQGVRGDADDMRRAADLLESISDEIADIYAGRTKQSKEKIRKMMKSETWMDGKTAVANGFADEAFDTKTDSKSMNILDRLTKPSEAEAIEKIAALENQISGHDSTVAEMQGKIDIAENALQAAATELAELKASVNARDLEIARINAETESIKAEYETATAKIEELEKAAEVSDTKIAVKAAELLAASGHAAPVNLTADTQNDNAEQIMAAIANEKDPAKRTELFRKHRETIKAIKLQ